MNEKSDMFKKTIIIKVNPENPSPETLHEAVRSIKSGGIVVFPTETVYGLGANAFDSIACKKIFEAKGRPPDNPLIVHIDSYKMLKRVVSQIPTLAYEFMERLWPGPLTAILPKTDSIPPIVTAGLPTVGVRMPSHPIARLLIRLSELPIAAPSANLSGKPSPTTPEHVIEDMEGRADVIIDGGETLFGIESTIIDFTKDPPVLLRPGPLSPEELEKIGKVDIHETAKGSKYVESPPSPGMKYRHYAPEKPLILVENPDKLKAVVQNSREMILICSEETMKKLKVKSCLSIGSLKNPYMIAKNLFKALREADKMTGEVIIVEGFPERGILFAVMNRLRKAASEVIK